MYWEGHAHLHIPTWNPHAHAQVHTHIHTHAHRMYKRECTPTDEKAKIRYTQRHPQKTALTMDGVAPRFLAAGALAEGYSETNQEDKNCDNASKGSNFLRVTTHVSILSSRVCMRANMKPRFLRIICVKIRFEKIGKYKPLNSNHRPLECSNRHFMDSCVHVLSLLQRGRQTYNFNRRIDRKVNTERQNCDK